MVAEVPNCKKQIWFHKTCSPAVDLSSATLLTPYRPLTHQSLFYDKSYNGKPLEIQSRSCVTESIRDGSALCDQCYSPGSVCTHNTGPC